MIYVCCKKGVGYVFAGVALQDVCIVIACAAQRDLLQHNTGLLGIMWATWIAQIKHSEQHVRVRVRVS